jgi:hypothetical protein
MENKKRRVQTALSGIDMNSLRDSGYQNEPRRVLKVDDNESGYEPPLQSQPARRAFTSNSSFDIPEGAVRKSASELERELFELKEQKRIEKEFAPKKAVQRFEILLGIGRLVDTVEIEGFTFQLRSLKNKELNHIMSLSSLESTAAMQALFIRSATLAYSLMSIDDIPFGTYIQSEDMANKASFIDDMEASVISKLWDAYTKMLKSHNEAIISDLGGDPKTIAENIKK